MNKPRRSVTKGGIYSQLGVLVGLKAFKNDILKITPLRTLQCFRNRQAAWAEAENTVAAFASGSGLRP
jgi:hypothetical protein